MKKIILVICFFTVIGLTGCNSNETFAIKEINLEMVKCPAGSFMMGSSEEELGRPEVNEQGKIISEILHLVTITKPFYIGKYEITQSQYSALMGRNPSEFVDPNNPVERISWKEAKEFINKLNLKYLNQVPQGYKFDFPTEAQWEYACRAGTSTAFNNDKNLSTNEYDKTCPNLDEVAWYRENSNKTTHNVGLKKPNAWGIYDMHGNVAEWCRDCLYAYTNKDSIDPYRDYNNDTPDFHMFRGGASVSRGEILNINEKSGCRSAKRFFPIKQFQDSGLRENCIGLRVALVPTN